MERLKEIIQPKGRNQEINMSDLDHFRQTTESFSEFWTELKRKFELARNKSTRCNDHKTLQCLLRWLHGGGTEVIDLQQGQ